MGMNQQHTAKDPGMTSAIRQRIFCIDGRLPAFQFLTALYRHTGIWTDHAIVFFVGKSL